MSLLITGTVAYDSIETPQDKRERIMGGSASYFSIAASFFTEVKLIAVVGYDMEDKHIDQFRRRGIDISGLEVRENEKSFYWSGKYLPNMNDRETLETQLNVLADFKPVLSEQAAASDYLFLANGSADIQLSVFDQWHGSGLCFADTMNLWINIQRDLLNQLFQKIDGLFINDSEAILLTGDSNLVRAGRKILDFGLKYVVLKKGEHGVLFITSDEIFALPAFPLETVVDPTGAGDSFAGALMGYLAKEKNMDAKTIKSALAYATVIASFTCEGFGWDRLLNLDNAQIEERMTQYRAITNF